MTSLTRAENWIAQHRTMWENSLDRLGQYLNEMQAKEDD
jgi:hypothetical protein